MKLTALFLLACIIQASAGSYAQQVSFSGKNVPLEKVFKAIEKQTGYVVFYNYSATRDVKVKEIDAKNKPLQAFLDECFAGMNFKYTIQHKSIVVSPKEEKKGSSEKKSEAGGEEKELTPPDITVKGRVTNENGEPIPGASVLIKGTKRGTSADANGSFTLTNVPDNATLVVSGTNIETVEMRVQGRTELSIVAKMKVSELDEVIVKPYWTEKKRNEIGNSGRITAKDIEKQPVQNPILALQGRVTGIEITQNTGVSGGRITTRIQGETSISSGLDPLIVIDGVPFPSQLEIPNNENPILGGSPLNYINPADIESIDVLKDADATAIYGSRAANGAILITTKKGKAGRTSVELKLQQGWGKVMRKMEMLNTRQYLDMRYEAYLNDGIDWRHPSVSANDLKIWDTTRYTDWQKELIGGTALYSNANLSVSGGNSNVLYRIGGTFNRTTTVFPGDYDDKRGSLHFSVNGASNSQRFRIQLSGSYLFDDNKLPFEDLTQQAVNMEPVAPHLFNPDGTINWALNSSGSSTWNNPAIYQVYRDYSNTSTSLFSNMAVSYKILPGLDFKSNFGFNQLQTERYWPEPLAAVRPERLPFTSPTATFGNSTQRSWMIDPQLNYTTNTGSGKLDVLLGSSIQQNSNSSLTITASGYSSDQLLQNLAAATSINLRNSESRYKYAAIFGRINYILHDKYIISLTARRDGSSRFGDENKFHSFGSAGLGWIFSQEKWVERVLPFLSFGKLRATYGTTGNDQISDYSYLSLYPTSTTGIPYQGVQGLYPGSLSNPYLAWESTRKLQLGIDLGFIKDRILLNASFSRNESSNQLLSYTLPSITGYTNVSSNFPATVENINWEFTLNTVNIQSKTFTWKSNFNLTLPRNQLLKFPNIESSSYNDNLVIGWPLSFTRVSRYLGIDPATGSYIVTDKNDKPTTTPAVADRTYFVTPFSRYYGGLLNSINYKGFQLEFLFQFVRQLSQSFYYNGQRVPGTFTAGQSNQPVIVLDRWRKPGDVAGYARFSNSTSGVVGRAVSDNNYSYDASFIRFKNVSLSWQMPTNTAQRLHIQNLRIFAQGQNLFTITRYKGLDPETRSITALPPLGLLTIGVQVVL